MCNPKEAKLAIVQPMYLCPYCLGSVLVQWFQLMGARNAAGIIMTNELGASIAGGLPQLL